MKKKTLNLFVKGKGKEETLNKLSLLTYAQELYPRGHPAFIIKTIEEMALHSDKNFDYAAGTDPLGNFKRMANILKMYPGLKTDDPAVVAFICALKQIDAYLWIKSNGHTPVSEGKSARLRDVGVYSKIIDIIDEEGS